LPLAFEANQGQTAAEVRYLAHGQGYQLFLTNQEAVLTLRQATATATKSAKGEAALAARVHHTRNVATKNSVLRMRFEGANATAEVVGTKPLPGKTNYFIGGDPKKWHTDIPSYEAVRYREIYPGVDLLFYGREQRLEYDFIVAPGADPNVIALNIAGARNLQIDSRGDVVMNVAGGKVALQKPVIYQEVNGERREIAGNYSIASDHHLRFSVAGYDHTQPLTIDPILDYSTFLGGTTDDLAFGLALDAAGNAYLAGQTFSITFPTMNPESAPPSDIALLGTAFVSEFNPTATALLYSTYLGGSGSAGTGGDLAEAIAVDVASPVNIYVTGQTFSPDFPVTTNANIAQPGPAGTSTGGSAFVTKLIPGNSGAAQLGYSSYLGGDTFDDGHGIAVDAASPPDIYVVGVTESSNFPSANPLPYVANAAGAAFVTEINPAALTGAASLVFSSYLGGSGTGTSVLFGDDAFGLAFGGSNEVFVVGTTTSTDFPTQGTQVKPCRATGSAFASEINVATPAVTYSTCLGGTTLDAGEAIALGANNLMYLTGQTFSTDFPTVPAGNTIPGNATTGVAFVSVINPTTGALTYSTLLGGNNGDYGDAIAVDSSGNAYVTGFAGSTTTFPITQGAYQTTNANPDGSSFIAEVNPAGANAQAQLLYSTFLGGSVGVGGNPPVADIGLGIALHSGNVYVDGQAGSSDFPTTSGAKYPTFLASAGNSNAFAAELTLTPTISFTPTSLNFGTELVGSTTAAQFVTITNNTTSAITLTLPPTTIGTNLADFAPAVGGATPCTTSLAAGASCTVGATFTPSIVGAESATLKILDSRDGINQPMLVALTGTGSNTAGSYAVTVAPFSVARGATGMFPVVVTGSGGFAGTVAFTCAPGAGALITSCSVPNAVVVANPAVTTVQGSITAASFIVPPQSMKMPPSALLRQVFFIMMAIALLFMLPEARRFRTRLGMAGAMMVFVLVAGCSGSVAGSKSSTIVITPSSGGVNQTAITVDVTITQ